MARFTFLLALTLAACQFGAEAAPLGNLKCNLARLKASTDMSTTATALDNMAAATTDNSTTAAAVTEAQAGLTNAQTAMQNMAAPGGPLKALTAAKAALDNINSESPIIARLKDIKTKLAQAMNACEQVADSCSSDNTGTSSVSNTSTVDAPASNVTSTVAAVTSTNTTDTTTDAADASDARVAPDATDITDNTDAADDTTATQATGANALKAKLNRINATGSNGSQERRQIGGIKCNIARVQVVGGLAASSKAVNNVATASAADAVTAGAAQTAQDGLTSAKQAIAVIAKNLITGQASPPDARTQVVDGLNTAKTALAGVNSTDPAVTSAITAAQGKIDATLTAGSKVVAAC